MINRLPNWNAKLSQYILEWQVKPFQWGKADCALFSAGAVEAMTGHDLARGLRGYKTEAGGLRKVKKMGFADHVDVFAQSLTKTSEITAGDIAIIERDGVVGLGVCQGRGIYIMTPNRGLAMVPKSWARGGVKV